MPHTYTVLEQALIDLIPSYPQKCQRFVSGDGSGVTVVMLASPDNAQTGHPESFLVFTLDESCGYYSDIARHARARDACECFSDLVRRECEAYFDPDML